LKVVVITHNYIRREGDLTALYLHRLSSGLAEKGLELTVVCPHAPGLLHQDTIDGVTIKRFGYAFSRIKPIVYTGNMHQVVAGSFLAKIVFLGFLWSFYRFAFKVCREEKADMIWANWWIPPGLVGARIVKKLNIPMVISSHGTDISLLGKGGILSALSRYVYARTSRATLVSSFLRKRLLDNLDVIAGEKVIVIPMPVGMEHFPKTPQPENDAPILLSVARYTRQKRLDDIISAAAKLRDANLFFKIVMVGEGPLEMELKELVEQNGLTDRVEFIPLVAQQKLGELYRQSDAVILSSEGEGFGLVLVEAGLTGRAVIGARSGGITDIINDGKNGLLYEVGDVNALADCIKSLLTDARRRTELGEGGYKRAMEKFSTPVLVDQVYRLFMSLMNKSQVSGTA
jgi:glycosyltransferase involved in cell wall biosynthesis